VALLDKGVVRRIALSALTVSTLLLVALIAALPAAAVTRWVHGTATTCSSCHSAPDLCTTCHTGGFSSRSTSEVRTCWTCHAPGRDMSSVQTAAGCSSGSAAAACHGERAKHYASGIRGCTVCHDVAASAVDPGSSAHHDDTPYTTPTCSTCHVAPHTEYVAGSKCADCHAGMAVSHPSASAMMAPTLSLVARPRIVAVGGATVLSGKLANVLGSKTMPVAGSRVRLQSKASGAAGFTALATTTTGSDGTYRFPALTPKGATLYRVLSRGVVAGRSVTLPAKATATVQRSPLVLLALSATKVRPGTSVSASAKVTPARPGGTVTFVLQRRGAGGAWELLQSTDATLGASSTCTAAFAALKKGDYRVRASVPATAALVTATTSWKSFAVK